MPKYSIIIPYRNRSIENTTRCLESIKKQTFQDFEIIFSDYGSEPKYQDLVKKLLSEISQATYVYNETRGMFWNRSDALNLGTLEAKGEWLVFCDVDMILPPDFLKKINPRLKKNQLVVFGCVYLTKTTKNFDTLNPEKFEQFHAKEFAGGGYGNIILHNNTFQKVGFLQSFFRIWGYEDLEFVKRAEQQKIDVQYLTWNEFPVFHQWHQNFSDCFPKSWREVGHTIFQKSEDVLKEIDIQEKKTVTYHLANRPAFQHYLNQNKVTGNFQIQFPTEYSFNLFYKKAFLLKKNEFLIIHQEFSEVKKEGKSYLRKLAKLLNNFLKRIKVSYRVTDIQTYHEEFIPVKDVEGFLFYFLLFQDQHFDYFFERKQNKILLILTPKVSIDQS